jgi:hypothetical protein
MQKERDEAMFKFAGWISDTVYNFFQDIGIERPGRVDDRISGAASKSAVIHEIQSLIEQGFNPVLVVSRDGAQVVPDFLLGSAFGESESHPALIIPIRKSFIEAYSTVAPSLPRAASFTAALHVKEQGKTKPRRYRHPDRWKFAMED